MGSVSFDMAPVYGHCGVELSGDGADFIIVDGFGNDSERCLLSQSGFVAGTVRSLKRCFIFLHAYTHSFFVLFSHHVVVVVIHVLCVGEFMSFV